MKTTALIARCKSCGAVRAVDFDPTPTRKLRLYTTGARRIVTEEPREAVTKAWDEKQPCTCPTP